MKKEISIEAISRLLIKAKPCQAAVNPASWEKALPSLNELEGLVAALQWLVDDYVSTNETLAKMKEERAVHDQLVADGMKLHGGEE